MQEIILKLVLGVVLSSLIGFDREYKSRPAGIRTHNLVCLGAVIISMVQLEIVQETIRVVSENPDLKGAVRADYSRLIAQIVSGIGFLGAGTIIVTRQRVNGLTTAASLWVTAGIGIAVGMGYYKVAIAGALTVLIVLSLLSRVIHIHTIKKVEISYLENPESKTLLAQYFDQKCIKIWTTDFRVEVKNQERIYSNVYTLEFPKGFHERDMIEELATLPNITRIRMIDI